jgi:hypothetical protein
LSCDFVIIKAHKLPTATVNKQSQSKLLKIYFFPQSAMAFKNIFSGIKTSFAGPSSASSVGSYDSSAIGSQSIQSSQYSQRRQGSLPSDERYTNKKAWNSVRPDNQKEIPQCVQNRTNINAWNSMF